MTVLTVIVQVEDIRHLGRGLLCRIRRDKPRFECHPAEREIKIVYLLSCLCDILEHIIQIWTYFVVFMPPFPGSSLTAVGKCSRNEHINTLYDGQLVIGSYCAMSSASV